LNKNGGFTEEFREYGTLIYLNLTDQKMVTHNYPCCGSQINYLRHYDLNHSADTLFNLVKIDLFIGRNGVSKDYIQILPKLLLPTEKTFSLTTDTTELRYTPTFDSQDICIHGDANVISRYPKNTTGQILAESIDAKWLFVRMRYNIESTNRCFTKHVEKEIKGMPHHLYGWINKDQIQ
jgi:hypothetical protein